MKKLYENPVMTVSCFQVENIVTQSGGDVQGANYLATKGYTADKVDVSQLKFTF